MQIFNQVGPVATTTSLGAGTPVIMRAGQLGDAIMSELHSPQYEQAYRRNRFTAANQGATATTVGLATTYTGICLSNPVGSTVNLVLENVGAAFIVAPAAALAFGVATGYNSSTNVTHTAALSPKNEFTGVGSVGTGLADSSATLPTAPTVERILGSVAAAILAGPMSFELKGGILLPPGAYAFLYTSAASGDSGFLGSFTWEEVPV